MNDVMIVTGDGNDHVSLQDSGNDIVMTGAGNDVVQGGDGQTVSTAARATTC